MDINEKRLRGMLARAKGGHKRVLQGRLDALLAKQAPIVEEAAPKTKKKKAAKKKK